MRLPRPCRLQWILVMLTMLALAIQPSAQNAPKIFWVGFNDDQNEGPAADAAAAGYIKASDANYTELLKAAGADVTRVLTVTANPDAALLNTGDLVIVSRAVNSPQYQNDFATAWNTTITAPTIMMSGYIIRSNRMGFTTGGTMVDTAGTISLHAEDPNHPVWQGIALDGSGNMVNPYAHVVEFNGVVQRGLSVNNNPIGGNGKLLGTVATSDDPTAGGMIIGEWQAGDTLTHDGGAGTDVLAGKRMVFLSGSREANGFPVSTAGHFDLEGDGEQLFFNAVNYMAGSNLVPPPKVTNISPAGGTIFYDPAGGFAFNASSTADIPTDGIKVVINGVDVSASLSVTGTPTSREVRFNNLETNIAYNITITITNSAGSRTVTTGFDTFDEAGNLVIEAEDFNFEGGGYFNDPILCNDLYGGVDGCYFDRVSVSGVDALDTLGLTDDSTAFENFYRYGPNFDKEEQTDTFVTNDTLRSKFLNAPNGAQGPIRDFDVETLNTGDWQNYTRTVEQGTYVAYLRASAGSAQEVQLGVVTSNPAQPNQTVDTLGTFLIPAGGYRTIPLTAVGSDTLKAFQVGGTTTFRLTTANGGGGLRLNYFFLRPFEQQEIPSSVAILTPVEGDRFIEGADVSITAAASGPDGTASSVRQVEFFVDGATSLGVDNTSPFSVSVNHLTPGMHTVSATATDTNGGTVESSPVTFEIREVVQASFGKIIWVSFHGDDDAPSADAAAAGFTRAADVGYTELLRDNGYAVTRYVTSNSPDPSVLNQADLVIISRSVPSGDYQNAGATAWNSITAPTIVMGGYTLRSSRMGYTTGTTIPDTAGPVSLTVTNPSHPIFAGMTLGAGNTMTQPYARIVDFNGTAQRGISVNTDAVAGNGTVLATIGTSGDPAFEGMVIGEWEAGATMGNGAADTLAGRRLVFLSGSREASGLTSQGAGIYDLEPAGETLFLNAVRYMLNPDPINVAWVSFHPADDQPSADAATAGFTEASDKGYTDLLASNGFNVTRIVTSNSPDASALNAADVVIISRAVPSGDYQNAGATAWNSIETPTIVMGGYTLRSSRMGFTTGTTIPDTTGPIQLAVNNPAHPIFLGVSLDGNNLMTNPFADVVEFNGTIQRGVSVNTNPLAGEGVVLATVATDIDPTFGGTIIAEWEAGAVMGNGTADVLGGPRIVFLSGSREASGLTSQGAGIYDLSEDGAKMFLNAVRYAAGLKPKAPVPTAGEFESITLNPDGSITLIWTGGGTLQSTGSLGNPDWQPVPGSSPLTLTPTGDAYYRTVQ